MVGKEPLIGNLLSIKLFSYCNEKNPEKKIILLENMKKERIICGLKDKIYQSILKKEDKKMSFNDILKIFENETNIKQLSQLFMDENPSITLMQYEMNFHTFKIL
jgi:hypothetical protein